MMFLLADADPILSFGGIDSQSGMLTDILGAFTRFIETGGQKVVAASAECATALIMLQFLKLIMRLGLSPQTLFDALLKFLGCYAWYEMATNGVAVTAAYSDWMSSIGAEMSGGEITGSIMDNPSQFMDLGLKAFNSLILQAMEFSLLSASGIVALLAYFVIGVFVLLCYIALGFVVVYVVIRSSIEMTLGLALVPFVIEEQLRFLAARGIWMIVDAGLKLGATSMAIGVSYGFLRNIHLQPTPTLRDGINLFVGAVLCALVSGGAMMVAKAGQAGLSMFKK